MKPLHLAIFGLLGAMAAVVLLKPFSAMGDKIAPGYADLINGGVAMGLLLLLGIFALFAKKRGAK